MTSHSHSFGRPSPVWAARSQVARSTQLAQQQQQPRRGFSAATATGAAATGLQAPTPELLAQLRPAPPPDSRWDPLKYQYVDKTLLLARILSEADTPTILQYVAPTGFGRTVVLDQLEAMARGQRHLFQHSQCSLPHSPFQVGENRYNVIRMDFGGVGGQKLDTEEVTRGRLVRHLMQQAEAQGVTLEIDADKGPTGAPTLPGDVLADWIEGLPNPDLPVVLLVDNFDAPLVTEFWDVADSELVKTGDAADGELAAAAEGGEAGVPEEPIAMKEPSLDAILQDESRRPKIIKHALLFRSFFRFIKDEEDLFHKVFLTGAMNLNIPEGFMGQGSVAYLNTEYEDFGKLFGFTRRELETTYGAHIFKALGPERAADPELLDQVESAYGGYLFHPQAVKWDALLRPQSVVAWLQNDGRPLRYFQDEQRGKLMPLVQLAGDRVFSALDGVLTTDRRLLRSMAVAPPSLFSRHHWRNCMMQAGLLGIRQDDTQDWNGEFQGVTLRAPNREVHDFLEQASWEHHMKQSVFAQHMRHLGSGIVARDWGLAVEAFKLAVESMRAHNRPRSAATVRRMWQLALFQSGGQQPMPWEELGETLPAADGSVRKLPELCWQDLEQNMLVVPVAPDHTVTLHFFTNAGNIRKQVGDITQQALGLIKLLQEAGMGLSPKHNFTMVVVNLDIKHDGEDPFARLSVHDISKKVWTSHTQAVLAEKMQKPGDAPAGGKKPKSGRK